MLEFKINYSQEFKLFDVLITKNNKFYKHFHTEDILFIRDYIKYST